MCSLGLALAPNLKVRFSRQKLSLSKPTFSREVREIIEVTGYRTWVHTRELSEAFFQLYDYQKNQCSIHVFKENGLFLPGSLV